MVALSNLLFLIFAFVVPFFLGLRAFKVAPAKRPWIVTFMVVILSSYFVWAFFLMLAVGFGFGFSGILDGFGIMALAPIGAGVAGVVSSFDPAEATTERKIAEVEPLGD